MYYNPEFMLNYINANPISYKFRKGNRSLIFPTKSVNFAIYLITLRGRLLWSNLLLRLKQSVKPLTNINFNYTI